MNYLPRVASFHDLLVYQKARALQREIFEISKRFPQEEMFALTNQIRRSSRAIGANIAEAWAKRRYEKHFISKLTDADGEQMETQHWIETARDCGYINQSQANVLITQCKEIGQMLGGMIERANSFWDDSKTLRESTSEYFTDDTDSPSYQPTD
ncbi:MAG: four helix bundle protein [Anaerolineae bacterium]|nr:four helix bundle protein [Anaerolineae bacterium]